MKKTTLFLIVILSWRITCAQALLNNIPTTQGTVYAILQIGDTIYAGGQFTQLGDSTRSGLGSFNVRTGMVTAWNPSCGGQVTALTQVGNKLIVTGFFYTIDTFTRYCICMFDLATGNLDSWSDTCGGNFQGKPIGVDSNYFYYARNGRNGPVIAQCDAANGITTAWRSAGLPDGYVNAVCVAGNYVYAGGTFKEFTDGDSIYNLLCRFNKADGSLDTSWHPGPNNVDGEGVAAIGVNKYLQIFIAGDYSVINGQNHQGIAQFDTSGQMVPFNPDISSNESFTLQVEDDNIWLGCNSYLIGGQYRWRLAEINIQSQVATCWDASAVTQNWQFCDWVSVSGDTVCACNYAGINIFTGSPRPYPAPNVIQGLFNVNPGQAATYSVPDSAGWTYSWNITGGTGFSIGDSITITWGSGPTGIIKMVENNNNYSTCSSDTVEVLVTIANCPTLADSINGPATSVYGHSATYSVPNLTGASYEWSITGGTGSSMADSINVTWGNTGTTGTVILAEANSLLPACANDTLALAVALSPSGISDLDAITSLRVFPNPATDKIKVVVNATGGFYQLSDVAGNLLLKAAVNATTFEIDLRTYSTGAYFLTLQQGDKQAHAKIIKQ